MIPLRVTATLRGGYAAADPWSPDLAAILAYWSLFERMGGDDFALGQTGAVPLVVCDDLPLGREADGDHWWWQVSSPIVQVEREGRKFFHRRFDVEAALTYAPEKQKRVMTAAGPYKNYRLARRIVYAEAIIWHCIGEATEIRRLLRRCDQVGGGRGGGWGEVEDWQITEDGDPDLARFHRPLPVAFAEAHGIEGTRLVWGIKPPGRHVPHQTLCVLP
ncbi:MAG: hypothetical protein AB7R89_16115 [Dehalococcoidia bacterium]